MAEPGCDSQTQTFYLKGRMERVYFLRAPERRSVSYTQTISSTWTAPQSMGTVPICRSHAWARPTCLRLCLVNKCKKSLQGLGRLCRVRGRCDVRELPQAGEVAQELRVRTQALLPTQPPVTSAPGASMSSSDLQHLHSGSRIGQLTEYLQGPENYRTWEDGDRGEEESNWCFLSLC